MRADARVAVLLLAIAARSLAADLSPHMIEVGGWLTCERGYVIKQGRCISFADIPPGPTVEISELPSAGDGAPGTCPSGGCGSLAPSYWSVYSGVTQSGYGGWSGSYYGGWPYVPGARHLRGGQLACGQSGPFGQDRRFMPGGFVSAPQRHFHSFSARGSHAGFTGGRFFGGSPRGVAHQRSGRGRAWP